MRRFVLPIASLMVLTSLLVPGRLVALASLPAAGRTLAQVRYIDHGLTVQPPHARSVKGRVKMGLGNRYLLRTGKQQRASIGFRDTTVLHLNQRTDAILRSPHLTYVQHGEVDQLLVPGTNHKIQTAAAVATAVGTQFDVRVSGKRSVFTVVEGALLVKNAKGSVLVKTGQQTTVRPNKKPSPPKPVNTSSTVSWTGTIPTPQLGQNIALDANGGALYATSSASVDGQHTGALVHDGRLDTGWQSAAGKVKDEWIRLWFAGFQSFLVSGVVIDPAATAGTAPATDLKDFDIRLSDSCNNPDSCTTYNFHGTTQQKNSVQIFNFDHQRRARYLELHVVSNYGSPDAVSVAELEVVGVAPSQPLLWGPRGIAVDSKGNIDVVDTGNVRMQQVAPDGKPRLTWAEAGATPGNLIDPTGVAVDTQDNIYVADSGNNRIEKFASTGTFIAAWDGSGNGQIRALTRPRAVALDAQGNMYVTDVDRVVVLSPSGQPLRQWGSSGTGPGFFNASFGVGLDSTGNVYVADQGNARVEKFSGTGQFLAQWGTKGTGQGQFNRPVGLAVDRQDNVYVVDQTNNNLQKFSSTGQFENSWGKAGSGPGEFGAPLFAAVDTSGNVYVADTGNNRIQKFSATGQPLAQWGMRGP